MTPTTLGTDGRFAGDRALTGELGSEGLRELACHPFEHGLTKLLHHCMPQPGPVPEFELVRTKYKPGHNLRAYYRGSQTAAGRWLAVTWGVGSAPPTATGPVAPAVEASEAEASRRHLIAPFARLAASDSTLAISLLVSPADPTMTQLVRLQDPSYTDDLLHSLNDPPTRLGAVTGISTVRYRPGQRHVLRVHLSDGRGVGTAYVKIDRNESGERAVRFARVMGPQLAAACPGAALCTPLSYVPGDRASVWAGSPGRLLSQALATEPRAIVLVGLLGRSLRFIHDSGDAAAVPRGPRAEQPPPASLAARAEAASTLRACEHIAALIPGAGAALASLSTQILDRLDQLPGEEPRVTHGDAKCDNVVIDGDTMCLLDLDRVSWGDPAMDLGKLLADLAWWSTRTGRDVRPLTASLVAGYAPCDPARWSRARLLAVLFQLKLTARRTMLHEAGWTSQVRVGMAAAARRSAEAGLR